MNYTIIYNEGLGFIEKKKNYKTLAELLKKETEKKILTNNTKIYKNKTRIY